MSAIATIPHMVIADMRAHIVLSALLAAAGGVQAQQAQNPDIFLADVTMSGGAMRIGAPVNITKREGYDNQPWFTPDGRSFLYSSTRDGQNDIFRYDIDTHTFARVTNTPENEYSPSMSLDGSRIMVVRWPVDMSSGSLWWFSADGRPLQEAAGSAPRVGYYTFVGDTTLALFINDSTQSFLLTSTRGGAPVRVGSDLGGSAPRTIPGARAVSFLRRDSAGVRWLSRLDIDTRAVTPLVRMLDGVANYTWTQRGTVIAARRNAIYEWRPGGDWQEVVSFTDPALQNISRIAITPAGDRIAFVSVVPPAG
jgi:dipeptidyl aminopeptidase/acylaminoacyl peptidase